MRTLKELSISDLRELLNYFDSCLEEAKLLEDKSEIEYYKEAYINTNEELQTRVEGIYGKK